MESLLYPVSLVRALKPPISPHSNGESSASRLPAFCFRGFSTRTRGHLGHRYHHHHWLRLIRSSHISDEEDPQTLVEELRVPDSWLLPSIALQESEWLRVALHKWLDDEYCPEETNIDISRVAAQSYYESLIAKQADIGLILLKMAGDLESLSFQESFHGAFSSANAAVSLIIQRIESANQE